MADRNYWRERFEQLETAQNRKGARYFNDLEKQYTKAAQAVEKELTKWYARIAKNNEISMTEAKRLLTSNELQEFRWNVKEYIEKGRTLDYSSGWEKELENASARWHISRLEAMKLEMQQQIEELYGNELDSFDQLMRDVYTEGYYRTAFEIQKGIGVGKNLARLDTRKIDKVMVRPWAADGSNFSSRIWKQKTQLVNELNDMITQSFIRGQAPREVINAMAKRFKVSKGQAGRLVMTETAFFHSAGQRDMFRELEVKEYEIVATLDDRTSEICQDLDGTHRPMSEYQPGVTAPPFHCWCRSTTVPYFEDEFTVNEMRSARGEDGKTYEVPGDMTYKEWKEAFVEGGSKEEISEIPDVNSANVIEVKKDEQQTDVAVKNEPSIENANNIATDAIIEQYNHRIDDLGVNYVKYSELDETTQKRISANFGVMDARLAEASAEQFKTLASEYETMCQRINVIKFDDSMETVPAATVPNMNIQTATISFNRSIVKDYDKFIERMRNAVDRGQFPMIDESEYEKYVITHEFAHTLLDFESKLKNYVNGDTKSISKARKEITAIHTEYKERVRVLTVQQKNAELEALNSFDENAWKKAQDLEKELKNVKISKYADMSIDEFMAEAFADAKIGSNPSEYSEKVLGVIDKYFGKKTIANNTDSSKIKTTEGNKKPYTKVSVADIPPMDENRFNKMKSGLERNGILVIQDEDGDAYLRAMGAEAMTLSDGSAVIFQSGRVPSASAVFEETIHTAQIRKDGMIQSYDSGTESMREYLRREIEANEKLIEYKDEYGLTQKDVESVKENLDTYYRMWKEVE